MSKAEDKQFSSKGNLATASVSHVGEQTAPKTKDKGQTTKPHHLKLDHVPKPPLFPVKPDDLQWYKKILRRTIGITRIYSIVSIFQT